MNFETRQLLSEAADALENLSVADNPTVVKLKAAIEKEKQHNWKALRPMCFQNKTTKKYFKVLPWFQPAEDESRFDLKGLLKDIEPELSGVMDDMNVYTGLVFQLGYMLENENRCWLGLMVNEKDFKEQFEEIGVWNESYRDPAVYALASLVRPRQREFLKKFTYYIDESIDNEPYLSFGHYEDGYTDDHWSPSVRNLMDIVLSHPKIGAEAMESTYYVDRDDLPAIEDYLQKLGMTKGTPQW